MKIKFLGSKILFILATTIVLKMNTLASTSATTLLVNEAINQVINGYSGYKNNKDQNNVKQISTGIGVISTGISSYSSVLLLKAEKLGALVPKGTQLTIWDNIGTKVSNVTQKAQKVSNLAKKFSYAGAALNVGLTVNDWLESDKSLVDNMTAIKDLAVVGTSFVPGAGTVISFLDAEVDILVDQSNSTFDDLRAASVAQANYVQTLTDAAYAKTDVAIAEYIGTGAKVDRQKIIEIQHKVGLELSKELEKIEVRDSWFDGDVAKTNFKHAKFVASKFSNAEHTETFLNGRVTNIQEKYDNIQKANVLLAEIEEEIKNLKQVTEKITTLEEPTAQFQNYIIDIKENNDGKVGNPRIQPIDSGTKDQELSEAKEKADNLLSENRQRAEEYESLYLQLKKDPNNKVLQQRVAEADKLLRESTVNYISLRDELRQIDNQYGSEAYSRNAIRDRIDKNYEEINDNKELLALIEKKQKKLDNLEDDKRNVSKKMSELKRLEEELRNTDEYITKNKNSSSTSSIDRKKQKSYILLVWAYKKLRESPSKENLDRFKMYANQLTNGGMNRSDIYKILSSGNERQLFNRYVKTSTTTSTTSSYQVYNNEYGDLQEEISKLESEIKKLNQDLTKNVLSKNDLEIVVSNLNDDINVENKQTLSNNFKNSILTSTTTEPGYWQGTYIGNYYSENHLGEPLLNGWTDSRSRTKNSKPDKNVKLYLHENGSFSNWENAPVRKTITLNSSSNAYLGDYEYTAWGTWSDPNANNTANAKVYTSHWVVGQRIDYKDRPKTGSASYTGELAGIATQIDTANTTINVNGSITLNANFGTKNITGSLNVRNASNGSSWGSASLSNVNMRHSNSQNNLVFDGQLTGSNVSNVQSFHSQISGEFYGKQAAEAGGIWAITKGTGANGDGRATGVFRAKKQ